MTFSRPGYAIAALLVASALCALYGTIERRSRARAFAYSNLPFAVQALSPARWPAVALFAAYACGCAILAISLGGPHVSALLPTRDGTVVLCIDTSGSMSSTDVAPNRAAAAQAAASAFVDAVPSGTRVGIVTFSTGASAVLAPTDDLASVHAALSRLPSPEGATAIGDALALAAQQMPASGRRVIVLLTDGVNNRGADPIAVSQTVGQAGVRIETVGIGSNAGSLIPGTDEPAELDSGALASIAANGGGRYVEAGDAGSLRDVFRGLAYATVWEKRRLDASLPVALGGGVLILATLLCGFGLGKFA